MRTTTEIITDIKDGKEVPYEELKLACLVENFILCQYQHDVSNLMRGGFAAEMTKKMQYSDKQSSNAIRGISFAYWSGMNSDPEKFLSPQSIPGTPENEEKRKKLQRLRDTIEKVATSKK